MERALRGAGPERQRPRADARAAVVVDGDEGPEEGVRVRSQPEHAQGADDARQAEVVVVEALDPVAGRAGEVGAWDDGLVVVVVVVDDGGGGSGIGSPIALLR